MVRPGIRSGEDHVHTSSNKLCREFGETIWLAFREHGFDSVILSLNPTQFTKSCTECVEQGRICLRRERRQPSDSRRFTWLLRIDDEGQARENR